MGSNNNRGYKKLSSEDQAKFFISLTPKDQAKHFTALSPEKQIKLLKSINSDALKAFLRALLQKLVGTSFDVEKELADNDPEQLKAILRSLGNQIGPFYIDPDIVSGFLGDATDKVDVGYHTFLRLWQVFGYVLANNANSDANNNNASFNQVMHNPAAAWSFGALSIVPAIIGAWIKFHQMKKSREQNSVPHQHKQSMKLVRDLDFSEEELRKLGLTESNVIPDMQDFINRDKYTRPVNIDKKTDQAIGSNKFANFIREINKSNQDKEREILLEDKPEESQSKKIARKVFGGVKKVWNFLGSTALVFWPVWMVAVLIIGIAATYVLPALPIIIVVSFAVTAAIMGGMHLYRRRAQKKADVFAKEADSNKDKKKEVSKAEKKALLLEQQANKDKISGMVHLRDELKQRRLMKKDHAVFKYVFNVESKIKENTKQESSRRVAAFGDEKVIVFIDKPVKEVAATNVPTQNNVSEVTTADKAALKSHRIEINKVLKKEKSIGKYLLGSKAERNAHIATTMVNSLIGNYTLSAFVLWLVGSAVLMFAPIAGAVGAAFAAIGGLILGASLPGISAAFNGVIGAIYSTKTFADAKAKQLAFEKKVYSRLSETYKTGETKEQAFERLVKSVNDKKDRIKDALKLRQEKIKNKKLAGAKLSRKEKYILAYDLKKIDVYNNRYFQRQEEKPSAWTIVKKGAFRLYKAVNAGQTWIFVTRSLFLFGAALAGICLLFGPGAGIAFLAIAFTLAAVGIAFKLTQMYLDKKAKNKEHFIDTFDARLSYLNKKEMQLEVLTEVLTDELGVKSLDPDQPAPDTQGIIYRLKSVFKMNKGKHASANGYAPLTELDDMPGKTDKPHQDQIEQVATPVPNTVNTNTTLTVIPTGLPQYVKSNSAFFQQEKIQDQCRPIEKLENSRSEILVAS